MSVSLVSRITAGIWFDQRDQTDEGTLVFRDYGEVYGFLELGDGSMDGEADWLWHTRPGGRRLAAGANETFDLTAMQVQLNNLTATLTAPSEIVAICISLKSSTPGCKLVVGAAASNEFTQPFSAAGDTVNVHAGSPLMLANLYDGWNLTGSAKNLKISNPSAVDVSYEMAILGRSSASTSSTSGS